nr:probable protein phosphatase 2C 12 [Tanacetum cinerariifolium]
MENSKRESIPMQEKLKLSKSQGASTPAEMKRMQNVPYASAVGSIMYAVRCTRLDVAFAQNVTSRFQQNPGDIHWTTVKNILKYLRNTKDMFLVYGVWICVRLNGGAVDRKSAKQSIFATSFAEAEYIAAFDASKEAVWVRKFIFGLGVVPTIEEPISMYCDNTGAIAIANESGITKDDNDNLTDPFTKALAFPKHSEHTRNIIMLPASSLIGGHLVTTVSYSFAIDLDIGPLRCWPGGLCLSRSIGDRDVGEFIVPVPYVKQVKLSSAGGRLVIASDGVWDILSAEEALECSRGLAPEAAAAQIVKETVQVKGLRDDTTCIVVDILPPEKTNSHVPPPKKTGKRVLKAMFRKKSTEAPPQIHEEEEYFDPDMVVELVEEGSAMLSERLDTKYPLSNIFRLFICAVCQIEMKPGEGISIHHASANTTGKLRPWDGPFLCLSCQHKRDAMEGKLSHRNGR